MAYRARYYNQILDAMRYRFGAPWYGAVHPRIWVDWRVQIKRLFDQGILIREIINAIPEACKKRKWPHWRAFFPRIYDVVLKNRRDAERRPTVNTPRLEGIGSIMQRYQP